MAPSEREMLGIKTKIACLFLSYHDENHLRCFFQLEVCRYLGAVRGAVAPGQAALGLPAPLRRVGVWRGGGGRGGAGHGTTHRLVLVGAELLDVVPVEAGGTEAPDRSEVDTLVISPAGAGVSETPI